MSGSDTRPTAGERAALEAAVSGPPPQPGDLTRESPYERRRNTSCGGEEESHDERELLRESGARPLHPDEAETP